MRRHTHPRAIKLSQVLHENERLTSQEVASLYHTSRQAVDQSVGYALTRVMELVQALDHKAKSKHKDGGL